MKRVKVLIIDSGVYTKHPALKSHHINGYTYKKGKLEANIDDDIGHGTAIYGILCECEPVADITCIRIMNAGSVVNEEELISLLEYVDSNMVFEIINLSLGINKYCDKLYNVCKRLYQKGTIIVSAYNNLGSFSYPAAFPFVIGVTSDTICKSVSDWIFHEDDVVQIGAFGSIQRLIWRDPSYVLKSGNSFACAHITKQIINCHSKGITKYIDVLMYLKDHAKLTLCDPHVKYVMSQIVPKISKAAIFPVSKETHAFFRFSDLLPFTISGVYDCKYSVNIKKSTNRIIQTDEVRDFIIQDIDSINWGEIDTIIVGHVKELLSYRQAKESITKVLSDAVKHEKNIYSFDNLTNILPKTDYEYYYYPSVTDINVPPIRYGKMHEINSPVLGIFGTSSKQGKFTLQLNLRKIFMEKGYSVGQLGTEPHSLLFGMNAVYPMGYDTTVNINHIDQVRYLNYVMHTIDQQNYDIIIVGSQSGTVNFDYSNINYYPIAQYCFLTGTLPDCVILCVNPYDDIDYIRRTINYIESVAIAKVIAIVIFPKTISEKWFAIPDARFPLGQEEYSHLKQLYYKEFSLPAVSLNDIDGIREISEVVIDFFADTD